MPGFGGIRVQIITEGEESPLREHVYTRHRDIDFVRYVRASPDKEFKVVVTPSQALLGMLIVLMWPP